LSSLIQHDKKAQESEQLADIKANALRQIAELSDLIQSTPAKDTINTKLWRIRSAVSLAKGLSVTGSDHQYLKTKVFPANRLYEKQKRFFSNEKKRSSVENNRGGEVLWEFLGGDVPLGPWNP